jgi:hypothetical protein
MNIVGAIKSIKKVKEGNVVIVKGVKATYKVLINDAFQLKIDSKVAFINILTEKHFTGTIYKVTDRSIVSTFINIPLLYEDLKFASYCKFAPLLSIFFGKAAMPQNKEIIFYNGIKGKFKDNKIAELAMRYPKELKGKFSYKPFVFSEKEGVIIRSILHFGKFPVVFTGDETKGVLIATHENKNKYVVINTDTGKMNERSLNIKDVSKVISLKNAVSEVFSEPSLNDFWTRNIEKDCPTECPFKAYCETVKDNAYKKEEFEKYFAELAKEEVKFRNIMLKTMKNGENPLRGSTHVILKEKTETPGKTQYKLGILENEAVIKANETLVILEKPPLERKVNAESKNVKFREIISESAETILSPEKATPLPKRENALYHGLYNYLYKSRFSDETMKNARIEINEEKHFTSDKEQNIAINKLLHFDTMFELAGEHGTGKKFVLRSAFTELLKKGKTVAVVTDSRVKETEQYFKNTLSEWFEKGNIAVYPLESNAFYEKDSFDYVTLLTNGDTDEKTIKSVMGNARNFILSAAIKNEAFDEKIPESSKATLKTEHRFGSHILHFLQPALNEKLVPTDDKEFKVVNRENISPQFVEVVNPEKYVQVIYIKGQAQGVNNLWNVEEATFIIEAIKEFIKAGIERRNIGVIVPYERQKALIESLLEQSKIPDIRVSEPQETMEKDVIFISFTNTKSVGGDFKNDALLKAALTRPRCKLLLVSQKGIYKTSKFLSKIL